MINNAGQECGEEQQPILGESAQRREAIEDRDGNQIRSAAERGG
jgi:hypothetical protein